MQLVGLGMTINIALLANSYWDMHALALYLLNFLRNCRDLGDFWDFIKNLFPTYAERRSYLRDQLSPLFNELEDLSVFGSSDFEQCERLGAGGFGEVYRYRHKLLEMDFAIKIFSPIFPEDHHNHLDRFFREARILFELNHPNIIRIYDVGEINKKPFIRMEYFNGLNLNEVLQKYGLLEPDRALRLISEIAKGLEHAHIEVGVIHRDLKPSNIMVAHPNQFRIVDFGLGVFVENDIVSRVTRTGDSIVGGYYTAPELTQNSKLVDQKCDIYSLGAIWYTMLVGFPPSGVNLDKVLKSECAISDDYAEALLRCLTDNSQRYSSCTELLEILDSIESSGN